jgi:hypothetical protein
MTKDEKGFLAFLVIAALFTIACAWSSAWPHDAKRPDLNKWFDGLTSGKGPCCSNADGTALSDLDWDAKDGHYRVRIEGQWWDVPDEAVLREPNLSGVTMAWPIYRRWPGNLQIDIRCFIVGTMG